MRAEDSVLVLWKHLVLLRQLKSFCLVKRLARQKLGQEGVVKHQCGTLHTTSPDSFDDCVNLFQSSTNVDLPSGRQLPWRLPVKYLSSANG